MIEKLKKTEEKYLELERKLSDPAIASDPASYLKLIKEYKSLEAIVLAYRSLQKAVDDEKEARSILSEGPDDEMRTLAEAELADDRMSREEAAGILIALMYAAPTVTAVKALRMGMRALIRRAYFSAANKIKKQNSETPKLPGAEETESEAENA